MELLEERIKRIVRDCINEAMADKLAEQAKIAAKAYIDELPITYGWEYVPKEKGIEQPQLPLPILFIEMCRSITNGVLVIIVIILTARNYHYTDKNDKHS